MYLSRLLLDLRSRHVRLDLRDCQELHRSVMSGFPQAGESARATYGVLYRVDLASRKSGAQLLVQSAVEPTWSSLAPGYLLAQETKFVGDAYAALAEGMLLRFRLRANVTKRVKSGADGVERKNGRRILVRDREEQLQWLGRKGEQFGFHPLQVEVAAEENDLRAEAAVGWMEGRRGTERISFGAALYEGLLRVTDLRRFHEALSGGIGPAKAYGFGLLSVIPYR